MANRDAREALRGAEEETFDLLAKVLTSERWAELLKAPLELAAHGGNRDLAQKLVRAGAEVGDALHEAVRGGHGDVVSDLLESGASVTAENRNGYTPLHLGCRSERTEPAEMVQLLLLNGADKDALTEDGRTPLYVAVCRACEGAALALLAAGAAVNVRCGQSEETAVHAAAHRGLGAIVKAGIERGVDVEAVDSWTQQTALHTAAFSNRVEAIDVLVEAGANMAARDELDSTPLHAAANGVSVEAVLALLKHGAHVNAQTDGQETPLHWAATLAGRQGAAEVVDSLLRSGADETILNHQGEAAAGVISRGDEDDRLVPCTETVERVRKLLVNAPADRAWRRRGYLVLCRAHPDRMQLIQDISTAHAGMARRTRSRAKQGRIESSRCSGAVDAGQVDERDGGDWAGLVVRVLGLHEEGLFRTIVGYC